MNPVTTRPVRARSSFGVVSAAAGALAIAFSAGGQLLAAAIYARDVNAGHPMAYQSTLHIVLITPSLIVAILAILIGCLVQWNRKGHRRFALLGIFLGGTAIFLSFTDVLGTLAAQYWIEPYPGGR